MLSIVHSKIWNDNPVQRWPNVSSRDELALLRVNVRDCFKMTLDDLNRLCDELRQFVEAGPGMDSAAYRRVKAIMSEIHDSSTISHTREKLVDLTTNFSIWLSHHKWHHYGAGGERLRALLLDDLEKLRSAWNSFEEKH